MGVVGAYRETPAVSLGICVTLRDQAYCTLDGGLYSPCMLSRVCCCVSVSVVQSWSVCSAGPEAASKSRSLPTDATKLVQRRFGQPQGEGA